MGEAYARRAVEYTELFGSMDAVHPLDRQLVATWAGSLHGAILDAGCGPGHWTNFLTELGYSAHGMDLVPAFIERARTAYPGISFRVGNLNAIYLESRTVAGVLAWYSLIHHKPDALRVPLLELSRILSPGGELVIGFFVGHVVEKFDHGVVEAWRWPVSDLCAELVAAGFDVVETHVRTTAGKRPHGAIIARLSNRGGGTHRL